VHAVHESAARNELADRDYVREGATPRLFISAVVSEPESGIAMCECAVGREPGSATLASHVQMVVGAIDAVTGQAVATGSVKFKDPLPAGEFLFATVRCRNRAGLATHASGDGALVIAPFSPATSGLTLVTPSQTVYDRREGVSVQVMFGVCWRGLEWPGVPPSPRRGFRELCLASRLHTRAPQSPPHHRA